MEEEGEPTTTKVRGAIGIFLSLAGVAAGITMLFLGMRSVMEIGGFCAEGGPFVIEHHCPQGVAGVMIGGIWGGIIAAGIYVWLTIKHKVPSLVWLFWPALFLSLGWNFLEFGLNPPGGEGLAWGWLVCAILFFLMGGAPLVWAAPYFVKALVSPAPTQPSGIFRMSTGSVRTAMSAFSGLRKAQRSGVVDEMTSAVAETLSRPADGAVATETAEPEDDLVSKLERLDALHRTGSLDDAQYEAAKREVLEQGGELVTRSTRWNWLLFQLAAILGGVYAGVRLFDWATG